MAFDGGGMFVLKTEYPLHVGSSEHLLGQSDTLKSSSYPGIPSNVLATHASWITLSDVQQYPLLFVAINSVSKKR